MNLLNGIKDMRMVKLYLGYVGFCWVKVYYVLQGGKNMDIKFFVFWVLIDYFDEGFFFFDMGYIQRFYIVIQSFFNKIYVFVIKVEVEKKDEIKNQFIVVGILLMVIKKIIIFYFYVDYVGGLLDFLDVVVYIF